MTDIFNVSPELKKSEILLVDRVARLVLNVTIHVLDKPVSFHAEFVVYDNRHVWLCFFAFSVMFVRPSVTKDYMYF
jgi:hypothetical protein